MQVCAHCGTENRESARFCDGCGAALTAPVSERRKLATLVFCDVAGSTALGERLDPEAVRGLMLGYFAEAREVLERHGGTVEKFIGDAVVAAFGVPVAHEDDALRACRAALEIQSRLSKRIALRIGVNTGEVVAGDASARQAFMGGDAVNVAARLEQAAPPGEVLVGATTYRLVRDTVTVEPVEPLAAKGKSEPLPAYRLLDVAGVAPSPRRAGTPLVGRGRELTELEQELQLAVASRSCRVVTVVGEPGVGKSRLAAELVARAGTQARAVRGGCLSYGDGITYWAIGQIVRELAGIRDEHSAEEARERLARSGGEVGARIGQLLGLVEGSAIAEETAWAIRRFLAAHAAERPLVVLLDDIHWAEPALLDLLAGLPAGIEDAPILVVCLARPELLETHPGWEVAVRLEPLGDADIGALLDGLGAPAAARERLAQAASGNPLFAEELVAWVRESDDGSALPTTLSALLGARLDRLEAGARDALERGAIEGELFHRGAVIELSEPEARPAVPAGLEALAERDLVRQAVATIADEAAFSFKHILVREAAYQTTAKKLRATLHEQFASWLERRAGERSAEYEEILGYHLEQSFRYGAQLGAVGDAARATGERAAGYLVAAGRRAADRGDISAAANLIERALAVGIADPLERARAQVDCAFCLQQSGRTTEAAAMHAVAIEAAESLGERGLAMRDRVTTAITRTSADPSFDRAEGRRIAEDAIALFTEEDDAIGLAHAANLLAIILGTEGRWAERRAMLERALVPTEASGDQLSRRRVINALARTFCNDPTPAGEAIGRLEALLELAGSDRLMQVTIGRSLGLLLAMAGRREEAVDWIRRSSLLHDELSTYHGSAFRWIAAEALELAGDRAGAERELTTLWLWIREARGGKPDVRAAGVACRLANFYCDDGRWDDAERFLGYSRELPVREHSHDVLVAAPTVEARLEAHRGNVAEAIRLARGAVESFERSEDINHRAHGWVTLAEVLRAGGHTAEADEAVARALELYEAKGNVAAAERLRAAAPT